MTSFDTWIEQDSLLVADIAAGEYDAATGAAMRKALALSTGWIATTNPVLAKDVALATKTLQESPEEFQAWASGTLTGGYNADGSPSNGVAPNGGYYPITLPGDDGTRIFIKSPAKIVSGTLKGDTGDKGWAPVIVSVADGSRRVFQVVDWTGGQGTKPAAGYVGPAGVVPNIANAVDFFAAITDQIASITADRVAAQTARAGAEAASSQANATVASWSDTQVIGRAVAGVNAADAAAGTRVMANPAAHDGVVKKMRLYASASGTLKLRVFSKSGATFTQVGVDYPVAVSVGAAEYNIAVPLLAGQYLGFYAPTGTQDYITGVTFDQDDGGYYATVGDSTSFDASITRTIQLQIGFDLQYVAITKARVDAVETTALAASTVSGTALVKANAVDGQVQALTALETIGRPIAGVSATAPSAGTFVFATPAVHSGVVKKVRGYVTGASTVKLRVFSKAGDTFTQVGDEVSVSMVPGASELPVVMPIATGQFLGFFTPANGVNYQAGVSSSVDYGGYYAAAGDVTTFDDSTVGRTVQLQFGFDIEYVAVTKARVDAVETTANGASAVAAANVAKVTAIQGALTQLATIGRATTPVTGSGAGNTTYAFNEPLTAGGVVEVFEVFVLGAGAAEFKLRRFSKTGDNFVQLGSDKVLNLVPGLNAIGSDQLSDWPVSAGDYLGFFAPTNRLAYTNNTSESGGWWGGAGDVTSFTDNTVNTTLRLEAAFHVRERAIPETAVLSSRIGAVEATTATLLGSMAVYAKTTGSRASNGLIFDPDAGSFYAWSFAADVGIDVATNQAIDTVTCRLKVVAGGEKVRLMVYSRPTPSSGADGVPGAIGDTLLGTTTTTLASLGLTVGAFGTANLPLPSIITPAAGTTLVFEIDALDASNARVESGIDRANAGTLNQRQRGWYRNGPVSAWSTISAGSALAWSLKGNRYTLPDLDTRVAALEQGSGAAVDLLLAAYPTIGLTGFGVTIGGAIHKNGVDLSTSSVIALTPAAAGKERLDIIVADKITGTVSVVAGTERNVNYDAIEYIPAVTAQAAHLATVLVGETAAIAVNAAQFRGLIKVGREGEFSAHVARNRRILRKVIGKAGRGAAIKWGGYGDSLTALQNTSLKPGTLAAQYVANGSWRDLTSWYFSDYPSDTKAMIDADRAARGNMGWNWAVKRALDELAGAAVTTYNNYGIGSTTSQNSLTADSGTGLPNGLYPDRIAVPLADGLDAVAIAFGMNERGQTYTYANIVNMIGQFQAVGTICVVIGVPRPNGRNSVSAWRYTNDALEAAAMDAGAAFVSTAMISDDRNLGGIGAPAECLGATNEATSGNPGNHPGLYEHKQYERAAVMQLGF
ncbi:tail fiber protein [Caulobacter phage TMCBR3]|nr:tail fiber protein [Caulobacter phage TMCBR3]